MTIDGMKSTRLTSSVSKSKGPAVQQRTTEVQRHLDRVHHHMQHRRAEMLGSTLTAVVDVTRVLSESVGRLEIQAIDTNERLDRLEDHAKSAAERFDRLDGHGDAIDVRLDGIDGRLDVMGSRLGLVEDSLRHLGGRIEHMIGLIETKPPTPPSPPNKGPVRQTPRR